MAGTYTDGTDSAGMQPEICNTTDRDGRPARAVPGQLVAFGEGDVICELGINCEAFAHLDDFETYKAAHAACQRGCGHGSRRRGRTSECVGDGF
jgi:hypothetical protein